MNGTTFYTNYGTDKYNLYASISLNNRARSQNGFREVYNNGCLENEDCFIAGNKYYSNDGYYYLFENSGLRSSNAFKIGTDYSLNENLNLNGELSFRTKNGNKSIVQSYIQDGIDDTYYTKNSTTKI